MKIDFLLQEGRKMRTKHVIVEDYNPMWKEEFQKIKNELLKL